MKTEFTIVKDGVTMANVLALKYFPATVLLMVIDPIAKGGLKRDDLYELVTEGLSKEIQVIGTLLANAGFLVFAHMTDPFEAGSVQPCELFVD